MHDAYLQFTCNIQSIRDLTNTITNINKLTTGAVDLSDLLRSQIVLTVSALDHFIHVYVRKGMLAIYNNQRPLTIQFENFNLPISLILHSSGRPTNISIDDIIREKHSWQSFQDPDKIADAIRLISSIELWKELGIKFQQKPQTIKRNLKLIVDRRNKIAHEADMDPSYPGQKFGISTSDVNYTIDFIEKFCKYIYQLTL